MPTIRALPLRRHWKYNSDHDSQGRRIYHVNRHLLNPFNFLVVLVATLVLVGPTLRETWVALSTLGLFLAYLRLRVLQVACRLIAKRIAPSRVRERDVIKVEIVLNHFSAFLTPKIKIRDHFSGTKQPVTELTIPNGLKPGEIRPVYYSVNADGGMGTHHFGPLVLSVSDPLGIFEYEIIEATPQELTIYPKVELLPEQRIPGSPDSHHFGNLDVVSRGQSSNFCGIHEYRRGDSLRKIAWRLSFRNQKLLVKDFEKVTNAEISLILDMNPLQHSGLGSDSTWEQAKDLLLGVAAQQIPLGNTVQLLSQDIHVPFGSGEAHFDRLALELFPCFPWTNTSDGRARLDQLPLETVPNGSIAYFFLPFARHDAQAMLDPIRLLLARDVSIICVFFHSLTFVLPRVHGTTLHAVSTSLPHVDESLRETMHQLQRWGISTHLIAHGVPFQKAFLPRSEVRR